MGKKKKLTKAEFTAARNKMYKGEKPLVCAFRPRQHDKPCGFEAPSYMAFVGHREKAHNIKRGINDDYALTKGNPNAKLKPKRRPAVKRYMYGE